MSLSLTKTDEKKSETDTVSGSIYEDRRQKLVDLLTISTEGRSKDIVRSDNEFMLAGIKGVSIPAFKTAKFGKKADEVSPFALQVCQSLGQMLSFGGPELVEIVEINFDLSKFKAERKEAELAMDAEIEELELEINLDVEKPNRQEDFEDALEIRLSDERREWVARRAETVKKTGKGKVDVGTPAKPSVQDDEIASEREWDALKESIRMELLKLYRSNVALYKAHEKTVKIAQSKKTKLSEVKNREVLLGTKLKGYQSAISAIFGRVKDAVCECSDIVRTLSMRVKITSSGEEISDPWYKSNLSGVKQLLMSAYNKASLVTFNHTMLSTISYKADYLVSTGDPMKVVQGVSRLLNEWEMMDYYAFMTKDIFFTAVLINALAEGSPIKEKVLLRANEYMSKLDELSEEDDLHKKGDMILYQHICKYVQLLQDSMVKSGGGGGASGGGAGQGGGGGGAPVVRKQFPPRGTELAAVGETTKVEVTKDPKVEAPEKVQVFRYNVTREHKVSVKMKGRSGDFHQANYTSTREACGLCAAGGAGAHDPKCYLQMCHKCSLYGHNQHICRQDPKTYVVRKAAALAMDFGALADEVESDSD
jgi:hypothetical protein